MLNSLVTQYFKPIYPCVLKWIDREGGLLDGKKRPIRFIQQEHFKISLSKSQLRTLSSLLPGGLLPQRIAEELPENISGELLKKFASILSPPSARTDAQRPFAKQNLDFIVQNANAG